MSRIKDSRYPKNSKLIGKYNGLKKNNSKYCALENFFQRAIEKGVNRGRAIFSAKNKFPSYSEAELKVVFDKINTIFVMPDDDIPVYGLSELDKEFLEKFKAAGFEINNLKTYKYYSGFNFTSNGLKIAVNSKKDKILVSVDKSKCFNKSSDCPVQYVFPSGKRAFIVFVTQCNYLIKNKQNDIPYSMGDSEFIKREFWSEK